MGNGEETIARRKFGGKIIDANYPILDTKDIPPGYVTVPVTIDDRGKEYESLMFAGHMTKKLWRWNYYLTSTFLGYRPQIIKLAYLTYSICKNKSYKQLCN